MGMTANDLKYPAILFRGQLWRVQLGVAGPYSHFFGGEINLSISGLPRDQPPFHRVLTLDATDPRIGLSVPGNRIPFLYGYVYNGCRLTYQVESEKSVRVMDLDTDGPKDDWPYPNYPVCFPRTPVDLCDPIQICWDDALNLTWQLLDEEKESDLIAIVPAVVDSTELWDECGIGEEVQTIMAFDPATRVVRSNNQCT